MGPARRQSPESDTGTGAQRRWRLDVGSAEPRICLATRSQGPEELRRDFLPASNLLTPTGQILAERTLYLPSIGVAMLLGLALDRLVALSARLPDPRRALTLGACPVALLILGGAWQTFETTAVWRSHASLFRQMIIADPEDYRGYWLFGMLERNSGSRTFSSGKPCLTSITQHMKRS